MTDAQLVQEYADEKSESSFRALVERYLPLVYSAALRQVRNAALAEDVTQVVFVILARKAGQLSSGTVLTGWLFRTTRHVASKALRTELRRRQREQEALQMQNAQAEDVWEQIAPFVDDAVAQLGEVDRGAVLLHYFERKRLRDVGLALGMTEDTAQKRVARAVEKLRKLLVKRGVALPVAVLSGLFMTRGALAAPSALTAKVVAGALSKKAASTAVYALLEESMVQGPWYKATVALTATTLLALVAGGTIYFWPKRAQHESSAYHFESKLANEPEHAPGPAAETVALPRVTPPTPALLVPAPVNPVRVQPPAVAVPVARTIPSTNLPMPAPAVSKNGSEDVRVAKPGGPASDLENPAFDPLWEQPNRGSYVTRQNSLRMAGTHVVSSNPNPSEGMVLQRRPSIVVPRSNLQKKKN
jgi:RNA polymerase sigma factor (sigma-70 family)